MAGSLRNREPLAAVFFERDTREVARELVGKILLCSDGDIDVGGVILETEAYLGCDDPGSHAATKGVTERNRVMYGPPGVAYVYFTYGMHHMLNLVTERDGIAGAVLVRALEPTVGTDVMRARRPGIPDRHLADGPAKLTAVLGVTLADNGTRLGAGRLRVLDAGPVAGEVAVSGRIGLSSGHELPLRYYLAGHPGVSKGRPGESTSRARTPAKHGGETA